jgi:methyltransferase-like protein
MEELEKANEIVREQYKDFLRAWSFRQTALCHREIKLAPDLLPERVQQLYAMCAATPLEPAEAQSHPVTVFRRPGGAELVIRQAPVGAAFRFLCSRWPGSVSFHALCEAARTAEESTPGLDAEAALANALIRAYKSGFLQLHVAQHHVANHLAQCPAVSELVRFLLRHGTSATSQLHTCVDFPDRLKRHLVQLLDGTRDEKELVRSLLKFLRSTGGEVRQNGVAIEDSKKIEAILEQQVRQDLQGLLRNGMLVP